METQMGGVEEAQMGGVEDGVAEPQMGGVEESQTGGMGAQIGGVMKMVSMPLVSVTDLFKEQKGGAGTVATKGTTGTKGTVMSFDRLISFAASIIFMVLAGYLCWECNVKANTDLPLRIIYTIIAVIFNGFYLIYYFIYRVLMAVPCTPSV